MARRDKRADIVNAGIHVFSSKGFSHCSVEDILQEAHVARATFYSYFDSKRDLFVELVDNITNTLYEIAQRNMEDMPGNLQELKERTANTIKELYQFFDQNLEFASIYIQEVMGMNPEIDNRVTAWQRRLAELISGLIRRGMDMGMFRRVEADTIGNLISGAIQHMGLNLFATRETVDIPSTADTIADYLIYGLAAR